MELAAHRDVRLADVGEVARPQRQLVVAAPGGGQVLQVVLGVVAVQPVARVGVAVQPGDAVEVDRRLGVMAGDEAHHLCHVAPYRVRPVTLHIGGVVDGEAGAQHAAQAGVAPAQPFRLVDIEPEAVDVIAGAQFLDLRQHQFVVAAARAQVLPLHPRFGGVGRRGRIPAGRADGAVAIADAPFRVQLGIGGRPADGKVDRALYADLVTRLDLRAEQVEAQMGMAHARLRRIVAPAMVALGERVDQIDAPGPQRLLALLLVETTAPESVRRYESRDGSGACESAPKYPPT